MSIALINKIKSVSSRFSAGYFGMVLGLIGTGMAWRYAALKTGQIVPTCGELLPHIF